jgi:glycosyltransferase involved in cell wall biosynthesis
MRVLYALESDAVDSVTDFVNRGNEYPKTYMWWDYINPDSRFKMVFIKSRKGNKIVEFIGRTFLLRHLQYQIDVIRRQKEYDAIFCSLDHFHVLIYFCRLLGILKKPIFGIAHYSFNYKISSEKWLWKLRWRIYSFTATRGFDYMAFFYENLLKKSLEINNLPAKSRNIIEWGADVDFFDNYISEFNSETKERYFMAIGSSNRDYKLLVEAFRENSHKLKIYQKLGLFSTKNEQIPSNVYFDDELENCKSLEKHQLIRKAYKEAYAVLIPLERQFDNLTGVTVLLEAIACGKAVVVTDNVLLPFDVEEEGIGFKIKYGDKQGWVDATNFLVAHPEETKRMGERAYKLAKTRYNYSNYKKKLLSEFTQFSDTFQLK